MRYAIALPNGGECAHPAVLADLAALAKDAGWDGVFLEDYAVYDNPTYFSAPGRPTFDPWVALAAMAVATRRVRLGTTVTPLARRPWKLARETVTPDHLSGGRQILGVGLGDTGDRDFTRLGEVTDPRTRTELLDEGLDVLAGLWSGRPFSYRGKHYTVDEVAFQPAPVQAPRIPVWVGGIWPRRGPVRRAARWDGAVLYKVAPDGSDAAMTADDVRALRAAVERERTSDGPYDIVVGGQAADRDPDRGRHRIHSVAAAGATRWSEWVPATDLRTMRAAIARGPLRPG